jgi:hypothetical protein
VEVVKVAQQKFYRLYFDPYVKFEDTTFDNFNVIETLTNFNVIETLTNFNVIETLTNSNLMEWYSNFNGGEDYLVFSFVGQKYLVYLSSDDRVGCL